MKVSLEDDVGDQHAAKVADGVQPMSVLATPPQERAEEGVYVISEDARDELQSFLKKSLNADGA